MTAIAHTPDTWPASRWPDFTHAELASRETGECRIDPNFMDRLQALRNAYGRPMVITSGYRTPDENARISSTGQDGPHTTGRAVDIAVAGADAHDLLRLALVYEFKGVGVHQKGGGRFLHLDDLTETDGFPRPRVWSY